MTNVVQAGYTLNNNMPHQQNNENYTCVHCHHACINVSVHSFLLETVCLYTKILEGLEQKLEAGGLRIGLEPLSFIASVATTHWLLVSHNVSEKNKEAITDYAELI